jgi:hypothetical protein
MKARFMIAPMISTIGYVLLALSTPSILNAQTRDYGTTRQPQTCPPRSQPTNGPIIAESAKKYLACLNEESPTVKPYRHFFDVNSLQMAPKSRQATSAEINYFSYTGRNIDSDKPIYDFKANTTSYFCNPIANNPNPSYPSNRGKSCLITRSPNSYGKCFQNTFGEWYCTITNGTGKREYGPPPAN